MIFDKFCSVVERHFPEFESLAREAKVFVFDKPAHIIKPGDTKQEDFELFTLPFPCTVTVPYLFYYMVRDAILGTEKHIGQKVNNTLRELLSLGGIHTETVNYIPR